MITKAVCIINTQRRQSIELKIFLSELEIFFGNNVCKLLYTEYAGHAMQLSETYSKCNVDLILAVGGDGTFNEVINGIILSGKTDIVLGLIPNGTGNDFCRAQGLTFNKSKIITAIKNLNYVSYDLGRVSQNNKIRYFLNVMDIGFGGLATHILNNQRKIGLRGGILYSLAILRTFFAFKKPQAILYLDQKEIYYGDMMMTAVCNSSTFGNGLVISPLANAFDGKLGVTVLGNISLMTYLKNLRKLKKGVKIEHESIYYTEGRSLSIQIKKGIAPIELDGEVFGGGDCLIDVVPKALKILRY